MSHQPDDQHVIRQTAPGSPFMTCPFDPIALMSSAMRLAGVSEQGLSNAQLDRVMVPVRVAWVAAVLLMTGLLIGGALAL